MIYIKKGNCPSCIEKWKKRHPQKMYKELPSRLRRELRNALLMEQGFICCFCGAAIGKEDKNSDIIQICLEKGDPHNVRNAHILPQSVDAGRSLDYKNICASCDSSKHNAKHCDVAQENKVLPITPLQKDCLSFFAFKVDGEMYGSLDKSPQEQNAAMQTINILELNSIFLKQQRMDVLKSFQSVYEKYPELFGSNMSGPLNNLTQKDKNGAFAPFFFVPLRYFNKI